MTFRAGVLRGRSFWGAGMKESSVLSLMANFYGRNRSTIGTAFPSRPRFRKFAGRPAVVAALALLNGLAGCASHGPRTPDEAEKARTAALKQADFTPSENTGVSKQAEDSVTYNIPISNHPEGKLEVISRGVQEIRSRKSDKMLPAMHVTMVVSNEKSTRTWSIDARTQQLLLRSDVSLRPSLVQAEAIALPMIEVKPGHSETIELFYAIPVKLRNVVELPGFELKWQIQTQRRLVSQSTKFDQKLSTTNATAVYPFDRHGSRFDRAADYPAMDAPNPPDSGPTTPDSRRALRQGPAMDPTWWADPFTEFPFPWRDMVY